MNILDKLYNQFGLNLAITPDGRALSINIGHFETGVWEWAEHQINKHEANALIRELSLISDQMEYPKDDPNDIDDEQYGEGPDYPY
jgi:hypothetical protein